MAALFDYAALIQDDEAVGVAEGGKAVGNGDGRAASGRGGPSPLEFASPFGRRPRRSPRRRMRMRGSCSMARAIDTRWRSPPDSPAPFRLPASRIRPLC